MGCLDCAGIDPLQRSWSTERPGVSDWFCGGVGSFSKFALLAAEHAFHMARHSRCAGGWLAGFKRVLRALSRHLGLVVLAIFSGNLRHGGSIRRHGLAAAPGLGFCGGGNLDCPGIRPRENVDRLPVEFRGRVAISIAAPDSNRGHCRHIRRFLFGCLDLRIAVRRGRGPGAAACGAKLVGRRGTAFARCGWRGEFWRRQSWPPFQRRPES